MKNISTLSSMTMTNHYSLIVSTNSYNICYLSWLVMAREQLTSQLELTYYKMSWFIIKRVAQPVRASATVAFKPAI